MDPQAPLHASPGGHDDGDHDHDHDEDDDEGDYQGGPMLSTGKSGVPGC